MGDETLKAIVGIASALIIAAIIALAKFLSSLWMRVAKIEWQLSSMATDASKALRNPRAATERLKELLTKFEEREALGFDELRELTEGLEEMRMDTETSKDNKMLASIVLREIERKYGI